MPSFGISFYENIPNPAFVSSTTPFFSSETHSDSSKNAKRSELEDQFILRLPAEPAKALKEAIRSGSGNLQERLSIKLEPEQGTLDPRLRKGMVAFDDWNMSAKVVDLPTIIESQKTIDRKTFYKIADICQMVICKEGGASDEEDNSAPIKPKKFHPNKVEKKYLFPHGICPPLKNCRKRRFRKTMKKNYEVPEIEKELRRLFRADEEAVSITWDLIKDTDAGTTEANGSSLDNSMERTGTLNKGSNNECDETDLFGALTDTDEDSADETERQSKDLEERNRNNDAIALNATGLYRSTFVVKNNTVTEKETRDYFKPFPQPVAGQDRKGFFAKENINQQIGQYCNSDFNTNLYSSSFSRN